MTQTLTREFDTKRDNELIAAGTHFYCEGCLIARPKDKQSPDPRYCQDCHDFLAGEAAMIGPGRGGSWIPRTPKSQHPQTPPPTIPRNRTRRVVVRDIIAKKPRPISEEGPEEREVIMSHPKRGPKHQKLPEGLIRQLAAEELSSRVIAERLQREHGITVSYKTIQRVLSGKREQLALIPRGGK